MPPPIRVELVPHDAQWSVLAEEEARCLCQAVPAIVMVHHVGSTAIPGIAAKPIIDLMPITANVKELDRWQGALQLLGYEWWGELGLPGRRYCTKSDPQSGRRLIQLHCHEQGSSEIERHLAFRDYLCARPTVAQAYDLEKRRCASLHPEDSHAYSECKSAGIELIEILALSELRGLSDSATVGVAISAVSGRTGNVPAVALTGKPAH